MACEYQVPDGRDFESVFARGVAGVDTGYKNVVGDDLGSYFAGGGSDIKTGIYTAEGVDLGEIFMPKGDANLQLIYVLAQTTGTWVRVILDLQKNSWAFTIPDDAYVSWKDRVYYLPTNIVSQNLDQDSLLYTYKRMMEGCRLVLDVHWGMDDTKTVNDEGVVSPRGFNVIQYPTLEDPRFIWDMGLGGKDLDNKRKKNVTFAVICNIYLH